MIIGWQITRDLEVGTLKINQSAFIKNLLEEKDLARNNSVNIPMKVGNVIQMNNIDNYKETNIKIYQRLVGKLMYLLFSTRPNISFEIGQLSKRNTDPRISHLRVTKGVVRYLKGIIHLGIIYDANNNLSHKANNYQLLYGLVGYINSNYAYDPKDRKSMMGHYFFINKVVVSWCSKK